MLDVYDRLIFAINLKYMYFLFTTEPEEGHIRLANGDVHFGRVEVYHSEVFGTICDDNWSDEAAQVRLSIYFLC